MNKFSLSVEFDASIGAQIVANRKVLHDSSLDFTHKCMPNTGSLSIKQGCSKLAQFLLDIFMQAAKT